MILAHTELIHAINRKDIICEPFNYENVGSESIDVTLGGELLEVIPNHYYQHNPLMGESVIDMAMEAKTIPVPKLPDGGWLIRPGRLYLGTTVERVGSDHYHPDMVGRSTPARFGFDPIISAGFGDVGFIGQWTLEITTRAHPMIIRPGQRIAQICFYHVTSADYNYRKRGSYIDQTGVRPGVKNNL
jgi:dCTP deaminase